MTAQADTMAPINILGLKLTRTDLLTLIGATIALMILPILMAPFNASAPSAVYLIVIFGIFAVGFNIMFGLTGYLSFGHAAFIGIGSYAAIWSLKLLTLNIIPALIVGTLVAGLIALPIGWLTLRRSGIYFSIITLTFAMMFYSMAFSVFQGVTNGQDGQRTDQFDRRVLDDSFGWNQPIKPTDDGTEVFYTREEVTASNRELSAWEGEIARLRRQGTQINGRDIDWNNMTEFTIRSMQEAGIDIADRPERIARPSIPEFFGVKMNRGYWGYYICVVVMIAVLLFSILLRRSSFGLMLVAVKTNQTRMNYMGLKPKQYALAAFVISAMIAGLAGSLMVAMDPSAPPDRMHWSESGKVVIMNVLGGLNALIGPFIGALLVKYFSNNVSGIDSERLVHTIEDGLPLPGLIEYPLANIPAAFVGHGWELGLGVLFVVMVIFMPGGFTALWDRWLGRTKGLLIAAAVGLYALFYLNRALGGPMPLWVPFLPLLAFLVYAIVNPIRLSMARRRAKRDSLSSGGSDGDAGTGTGSGGGAGASSTGSMGSRTSQSGGGAPVAAVTTAAAPAQSTSSGTRRSIGDPNAPAPASA